MRLLDLVGQIFGKLTVLSRAGRNKRRHALWLCVCSCGQKTTVSGDSLRRGDTKSCGCLQRENATKANTKHGHAARRAKNRRRTSIYNAWVSMKSRCLNERDRGFPNYGGRGIIVCERWLCFEAFLEDMGERPSNPKGWKSKRPYYTLDRIDNDGNYERGNCRWADAETQNSNRREMVSIERELLASFYEWRKEKLGESGKKHPP